MDLLNLFKNFCVALVLMQTFAILAIAIMVTVEEHFFRNNQQDDKPGGIGKRAFCTLTGETCVYADKETCEDCPAAMEHFYKAEENGVDKVRGFQNEGRADQLP